MPTQKHRTVMRTASLLLLFSACAGPARAEWVEWLFDGGLSAQFDDNINKSFSSEQARDEGVWSGVLSGGRAYQWGDYSRVYLNAVFSGDLHQQFQKLDQYTLGGNARLTHKFGLGWEAPSLSIASSVERIFSDSVLRNGDKLTHSLRLSRWLHHNAIQAHITYRFDHRNGATVSRPRAGEFGSAFNTQGHTLETSLNLSLSERARLNASYGWRWGDITSNNSRTSIPDNVENRVHALNKDDALPDWVYRAYGTTQTLDVSLNYSFSGGHAMSTLGYRYIDTQALGMSYQNNQVRLSFNYSY